MGNRWSIVCITIAYMHVIRANNAYINVYRFDNVYLSIMHSWYYYEYDSMLAKFAPRWHISTIYGTHIESKYRLDRHSIQYNVFIRVIFD